MKERLAFLWQRDARIGRVPYFLIGVILFAIKHNLDRYIAASMYGRPWTPFNYLMPSKADGIVAVSHSPALNLYAALLLLALPFIAIGVLLTLRRLNDANLPLWLVLIFFIPLVNLLFFLVLSLLPSREGEKPWTTPSGAFKALADSIFPESSFGSACVGLLITVPIHIGVAVYGATKLENYGWGLFLGVPFSLGLTSVMLYGYRSSRTLGGCLLVGMSGVALIGAGLIAFAVEGAICLIMAAPLGILLACIGAGIGYALQLRPNGAGDLGAILVALTLATPALMGAEARSDRTPPVFAVVTSVVIAAPPEQVWRHVVTFAELPPPKELLFRLGIAYPMRAEIEGQGVGAIRRCVFSTGAFVEPIQVWDAPRLLKFSVTQNPPPMEEWTPYRHVHPAHLEGYLVSNGGQFRLIPLPNGHTRLEGTTWYRHSLWPAAYWKVWSDSIIHTIHLRVLNHVKQLSERDTR